MSVVVGLSKDQRCCIQGDCRCVRFLGRSNCTERDDFMCRWLLRSNYLAINAMGGTCCVRCTTGSGYVPGPFLVRWCFRELPQQQVSGRMNVELNRRVRVVTRECSLRVARGTQRRMWYRDRMAIVPCQYVKHHLVRLMLGPAHTVTNYSKGLRSSNKRNIESQHTLMPDERTRRLKIHNRGINFTV